MKNKQAELFDSLAALSVPLERAVHLSLDLIKQDEDIKDKYRNELIASVKALLYDSLELHEYLRRKNSNLDFTGAGRVRYAMLRNDFKIHFPSFADKDFNLLEMIDNETDLRAEKSILSKKPKPRTK